jgi:hypothetical protein
MRIDVDYEHHPAFAPFMRGDGSSSAIASIIAEMDDAIDRQVRGHDPEGRGADLIRERFRRLVENDDNIESGLKAFVIDACQRARDRSLDEQTRRFAWGKNAKAASAEVRRQADLLLQRGHAVHRMPRATIAAINALLKPDIEKLRQSASERLDDIIITQPSNRDSLTILHDFCNTSGIFDVLSTFYDAPVRYAGFVIHYSHPKDMWFRMFDDIGLEMPRTAQMHYDLAFFPPKAMLYLNDVGEDQGPFSLVPKATPWDSFGFELALRKELLYSVSAYTTSICGKSVAGNTSIFRFTEARRAFASLPRALRGTSHPGDHILDGTDLSNKLLASEIRITGEAGTMALFSGSHVLHRGGLVKNGERIALQIVFELLQPPAAMTVEPPSVAELSRFHLLRAAGRKLRGLGKRLLQA